MCTKYRTTLNETMKVNIILTDLTEHIRKASMIFIKSSIIRIAFNQDNNTISKRT